MAQATQQAGGSDDVQIAEAIVAAPDNPIAILGLPEPKLNALGKVSWLPDEDDIDRAIIKAFRSRVLHVHPDRSAIGHEPLAIQAYCLLQDARDLLLDPDKRQGQLDAWQAVLKRRKPDGWVPARVTDAEPLAAGNAERQRLRQAELAQRQAEVRRRSDSEFRKRMVAAPTCAAAAPAKRSRPVMQDSALYSSASESGSESESSDSDADDNDGAASADDEMKRAMAIRERQRQRRRR